MTSLSANDFAAALFGMLMAAALAAIIIGLMATRPIPADIVYDYDCSNGAHLKEANC